MTVVEVKVNFKRIKPLDEIPIFELQGVRSAK